MEKFCKKCVHCRSDVVHHKCVNPEVAGSNAVTGKVNIAFCQDMRAVGYPCGIEGKFWERKRSVFERLRDKRQALAKSLDERY